MTISVLIAVTVLRNNHKQNFFVKKIICGIVICKTWAFFVKHFLFPHMRHVLKVARRSRTAASTRFSYKH